MNATLSGLGAPYSLTVRGLSMNAVIIRLLLWAANATLCRRGCPRVLIAHCGHDADRCHSGIGRGHISPLRQRALASVEASILGQEVNSEVDRPARDG